MWTVTQGNTDDEVSKVWVELVREIDYGVTMKCQLCLTYGNLYTRGVCLNLVMHGVVGMLVWDIPDIPTYQSLPFLEVT